MEFSVGTGLVRVNGALLVELEAMNLQSVGFFPTLYGSDFASKVGSDFFPGVQTTFGRRHAGARGGGLACLVIHGGNFAHYVAVSLTQKDKLTSMGIRFSRFETADGAGLRVRPPQAKTSDIEVTCA